MSKDATNLLQELLEYQYETEKIKRMLRKAYQCGHGEGYRDTAIVIKEEDYPEFRNWLEGE